MLKQKYLQAAARLNLLEEEVDVLSHGHIVLVVGNRYLVRSGFFYVRIDLGDILIPFVLNFIGVLTLIREVGTAELVEDDDAGYGPALFLEMPFESPRLN